MNNEQVFKRDINVEVSKCVNATSEIAEFLAAQGHRPEHISFTVMHFQPHLLSFLLAAVVKLGDFPMAKYLVGQGMDVTADEVRAATPSGGAEIAAFLSSQGQRP